MDYGCDFIHRAIGEGKGATEIKESGGALCVWQATVMMPSPPGRGFERYRLISSTI